MTNLSSPDPTPWSINENFPDCHAGERSSSHILPANPVEVGAASHGPENSLACGSMNYPGANNGMNDYLMEGGTRSYLGLVRRDEGFGYADKILTSFKCSNAHGMVISDREFIRSEAVNRSGQPANSADDTVGYLIGVFHQAYGKPPLMHRAIFVLPPSRAVAMILHQVASLMLCEGASPELIIDRIRESARDLHISVADHALALNNSQ